MDDNISILIVSRYDEDQKLIHTALSKQNDFLITGIEKDETGAIIKTERLKPNILILDLQLSETNGLELVRILRRKSPTTAIIIFCDNDEKKQNRSCSYPIEIYVSLALKAGISGFLIKETDIDILTYAVKLVFLGRCYISASITTRVFSMITHITQLPEQEENNTFFSPAERGIITALANGLSDAEIAKILNYSEGTIKNCLSVIKRKHKFKNRIQIVVHSLIFGLIRLDQLDIFKNKLMGASKNHV